MGFTFGYLGLTMNIYFISIGGAIMHNLAIALHLQGHQVSGSDDEVYEPAYSQLKKYQLLPDNFNWDANRIHSGIESIILGMHARADNPELLRAKELGLKIYSFPEFMYEHTKNKHRIVVGGSHGKTSTTSMILHVLKKNNVRFDYLVGSRIPGFETMVGLDEQAPYAIFEGDEYLSSALDRRPKFHLYHPQTAIITGIAWDHANVFPTWDIYKEQFRIFINQIPSEGHLFYYENDQACNDIIKEGHTLCSCHAYNAPPYSIENNQVMVQLNNQSYALSIFGQHNLQNMMAARAACHLCGVNDQQFFESIKDFTGAAKRLETVHSEEGFQIFRDFAHAPSKLKATIQAVRELHPQRKLIAVYELHTFSSLSKNFLPQYAKTMDDADIKLVYFSNHALEMKKLDALSCSEVAQHFGKNVIVFNDIQELKQAITKEISINSDLLLMSSGTFDGMDIQFNIHAK